jgi:hypothetical protein
MDKIFEGDQRLETLLQALKEEIYERGEGIPVPAIVGVLELLKLEIIEEQK